MSSARRVAGLAAGAIIAASMAAASAQPYPYKPIRIVTSNVGGGSDFIARLIARGITGPLGQPLIVENRPSGVIPAEIVSKAPPDGYTLYLSGSNFWIGPLLQKTPYEPVRGFSPISLLVREVYVVAVHPSVAAKSIKELIELAKAKPGELNYSTSAIAGPTHLAMELFKSMAGVNIVHIPYKGSGPAVTGLVAGQVQMMINSGPALLPQIKAGKLRALAITSAEPSALAPGLPTVAAAGLSGYEMAGTTGIFAPAKTPGAVIKRLNQEIARFLKTPEVTEKLFSTGAEVVASTPEELAATVKADIARLGKVIKDAGIKVE